MTEPQAVLFIENLSNPPTSPPSEGLKKLITDIVISSGNGYVNNTIQFFAKKKLQLDLFYFIIRV